MKMGSLFDGSGGFPLIASVLGIEPVWAAEVEPFPIKVTRARFPNMKHLGDVSKIKGDELEPVDIITGGSPCQSLSLAGKRDGLSKKCLSCGNLVSAVVESDICPVCGGTMAYTRSGLFMEQIRIVKEMREHDRKNRMGAADESVRPRFMLWENVPGAFSSNGGEDFRVVLEEIVRVKEKTATVPRPEKGKWQTAGCIMGDGYSVAWRVLDAQFWGVPQRRRRIALVADFGGQSVAEILFEREGLSGHLQTSNAEGKETPRRIVEGFDKAGQYSVDFGRTADRIQMNADKSVTLLGLGGGGGAKTGLYCLPVTMQIRCGKEGGGKGPLLQYDKSATLATRNTQTLFDPKVYKISPYHSNAMKSGNPYSGIYETDKSSTLSTNGADPCCNQGGLLICHPVYGFDRAAYNMGKNDQYGLTITEDVEPTLIAKGPCGIAHPKTYSMQAIGEYKESEIASTCKQRDFKDATDLICMPQTVCIEGNGSRPSHKGDGWSETDKMYTLNTVEKHGVAYYIDEKKGNTYVWEDQGNTLAARDYKQPQAVCYETEIDYIIRRLTELEESRLQGFPDWWTEGTEIENPSEEEFGFWRKVFDEHFELMHETKKPKTDKEILKWLASKPNSQELYKMWGNGIALPPFLYVMEGIKAAVEKEKRC